MGEKTVVLDAAKEYTVWEFIDRAKAEGKNEELLREFEETEYNHDDLNKYKILEETGLMVSFYDIIDWFNKEYLKIREDAKTLPKIELEIDKWEIGKKEKVLFSFLRCNKERIVFTEDPVCLYGIIHRELSIADDSKNLFYQDEVTEDNKFSTILKCIGVCWDFDNKIDGIDKEEMDQRIDKTVGLDQNVMRQYRAIVDKYYNYLNAYAYFNQRSNRLSKAFFNNNQHTTINAGIYGGDPFRNLDRMAIMFGQGGNEPVYSMTYNLGTETLEKPRFRFREMEGKFGNFEVLDKDDLVNNNYHEVAKTLKLCKTYLPFEITSSK